VDEGLFGWGGRLEVGLDVQDVLEQQGQPLQRSLEEGNLSNKEQLQVAVFVFEHVAFAVVEDLVHVADFVVDVVDYLDHVDCGGGLLGERTLRLDFGQILLESLLFGFAHLTEGVLQERDHLFLEQPLSTRTVHGRLHENVVRDPFLVTIVGEALLDLAVENGLLVLLVAGGECDVLHLLFVLVEEAFLLEVHEVAVELVRELV